MSIFNEETLENAVIESVRIEILPQHLEALRAEERVGFIRLSRTEVGL